MNLLKVLFTLSVSLTTNAEDLLVGIYYFKPTFGHVHKGPSKFSSSLTTIACGHPVKVFSRKVLKKRREVFGSNFAFVKAGPYKGYLNWDFLSPKLSLCQQDKYPKFFNFMNLSLTEMYYWGKLTEQSVRGKSQVK